MNECSATKQHLADWLNGRIDPETLAAFERHCAVCTACAEDYAVVRRLKETMTQVAASPDPFPSDLEDRLHRCLAAIARRQPLERRWFGGLLWRPVAAGVLLVCIAVAAVVFFRAGSAPVREETDPALLVSRAEVKAGEPITVELTYEASRDIAEAEVVIELGEGISFFSSIPAIMSEKRLSWKGPLTQGKNLIPFVVAVERPGTWRIATTAVYEGHRHRHRVVLTADQYKVMVAQYRFPPEALDAAVH